ncbi:TolC family protein, partial [Helicobacter pylori]
MKKTTLFVLSLLFNGSLNAVDGVSKTDLSSLSMAEDSAPLNHPNAQKLSLKNAWTRVLSSHEGLHAQEYAIKRASKMKLAAKLSFLPQIDLSAFYVYLSNPIKMDFASQ